MTKFSVIVADPPWPFRDKLPGPGRGAAKHYETMTQADIEAYLPGLGLPIADDAWLFLWRVASQVEEAYRVARAWGFVPKAEIVWVKSTGTSIRIGMGRTVRNAHEVAIVATRGRPHRADVGVPSVFFARRGQHSEKPQEFFDAVDRLVGPARRIELFARARRPGWDALGRELP